jgi:hypothetical protein
MMFSPLAILRHLQTYLPRLTDKFCTNVSCSGLIVAGTPQKLRVTLASHGRVNGEIVSIINTKIDNGIDAVSEYDDDDIHVLRFTTNAEHDLTLGYEDNIPDGVELRGFTDIGLNGYHELYGVPSKTTFEIAYATMPTLNGSEVLRQLWEEGLNGTYTISNVTATTFDITLTDKPTFDIKTVPQIYLSYGFRMDIAASFDRVEEKYIKQTTNDLYLYVIMGDCITSKDQNINSDSYALNTPTNELQKKLINTFDIVVFWNTKQDIGGSNAVTEAWTTIYTAILACLEGKTFDTFDKSNYTASLKSHSQAGYNLAYYAHGYEFEFVYDITIEESFLTTFMSTRALRGIDFSFMEDELDDGSNIIFEEE